MNLKDTFLILITCLLLGSYTSRATDYYVHPTLGNDTNTGLSKSSPLRTLAKASLLHLRPGDNIYLAGGVTHYGTLKLVDVHGQAGNSIRVTSLNWAGKEPDKPALIDFKNYDNGVLIEDSSFITLTNIRITGNGYENETSETLMNCGVLISNKKAVNINNINLDNLQIIDVYHENPGFARDKDEVKTANGTQSYGWGIRVISNKPNAIIEHVNISNCSIQNVSHTGIKLTGSKKNIRHVKILNNTVSKSGGPGIQMSEVVNVYVAENTVTHSGSNDDPRKWGRGSGLWTWGSSHVLIEKNNFLYANGPGDSAGAHIDFNCDNIVLQYNISAYNAGGFCEILGNNYNCAYRYNLSINDGNRKKGKKGAFQEGKIFWLSGYQGSNKERKGPVNTYFYNNTVYSDGTYLPKIAIENTSQGILIANNIFCIPGEIQLVPGDQYRPEQEGEGLANNVIFKNNLFVNKESWPQSMPIKDSNPIFGNPRFKNPGLLEAEAYWPMNKELIFEKGIKIELLPGDHFGLLQGLEMNTDILGTPIKGKPGIGAINLIKN